MKQISLFKNDKDRELFQEIRIRVERYRSFKFLRYLFSIFGTFGLGYLMSFFVIDIIYRYCQGTAFARFIADTLAPIQPRPWGEPLSIGFVVVVALMFIVAVLLTAFRFGRAQRRDVEDYKFLHSVYSDDRLEGLYLRVTARFKAMNDLKIVAEGLTEDEIKALTTEVRKSGLLSEFDDEGTKAWSVFIKATDIIGVQTLAQTAQA